MYSSNRHDVSQRKASSAGHGWRYVSRWRPLTGSPAAVCAHTGNVSSYLLTAAIFKKKNGTAAECMGTGI